MRPRIFIDTWGWLSLRDRTESRHAEVRAYTDDLLEQRAQLVTTDYVLDETITLLVRRLPFDNAMEGYDQIRQAKDAGFLDVKWITPDRFDRAMDLRQRYDDKPDISFTDLSSMAVMQEVGLRDVLTGDAHFEHVGLGFRLRP
jgi:predicted nucleic acid-binding protein